MTLPMTAKARSAALAAVLTVVVALVILLGLLARRTPPAAVPPPLSPPNVEVTPPVAKPPPPNPRPAVPPARPSAMARLLDRGLAHEDRVLAVQELDNQLTKEDCATLRELLKDPTVHPSLRNDVLNRLEAQTANPPAGLVTDLLAAAANPAEDATWRDYALQHLGATYGQATPGEQRLAGETLRRVAGDPAAPAAGTAMLTLERLGAQRRDLQQAVLVIAREALAAADSNLERRIVALCVCRNARDATVLPTARQLAGNAATELRLRLAAIGAIGDLGDASDVPLLSGLAGEKASPVQAAAVTALAQLQRRLRR